jgi:hypothetical protein
MPPWIENEPLGLSLLTYTLRQLSRLCFSATAYRGNQALRANSIQPEGTKLDESQAIEQSAALAC